MANFVLVDQSTLRQEFFGGKIKMIELEDQKYSIIYRGRGPGGAWGGRAPPRIWDLLSKILKIC